MAVWRRKPRYRVLIHSDQGSQFTGMDWAAFIRAHNLEHSMSRRGNCHDSLRCWPRSSARLLAAPVAQRLGRYRCLRCHRGRDPDLYRPRSDPPGRDQARCRQNRRPGVLRPRSARRPPDLRREVEFFPPCTDFTLFVVPGSAHCQTFASTRHLFWKRMHGWIRRLQL